MGFPMKKPTSYIQLLDTPMTMDIPYISFPTSHEYSPIDVSWKYPILGYHLWKSPIYYNRFWPIPKWFGRCPGAGHQEPTRAWTRLGSWALLLGDETRWKYVVTTSDYSGKRECVLILLLFYFISCIYTIIIPRKSPHNGFFGSLLPSSTQT